MARRFLTPGWVALHVFVIVFLVTSLVLGWWQWERAHAAGGGAQNVAYALQWPLFGAFGVFLWVRLVRLENQRAAGPEQRPSGAAAAVAAGSAGPEPTEPTEPPEPSEPAAPGELPDPPDPPPPPEPPAGPPTPPEPPSPPVDEEEDEQLAAYNRMLALLAERDRHVD